jgi:putative ABC transport system permease protein
MLQPLRSLIRQPGFTVPAVITLAVAIGATTAIFSVVEGVILRPLPFRDPQRLMVMWETDLHNNSPRERASLPDYRDFDAQTRSFETLAALQNIDRTLTDRGGTPQRLDGVAVSHDMLSMLGIAPMRGRAFDRRDDVPEAAPVVIIGEALWRSRYGGSDSVLGTVITLDGTPHEIIGVMPARYDRAVDTEIWVALGPASKTFADLRGVHNILLIGRLKDGLTRGAAEADVAAVAKRLEKQYPDSNVGRGATLEPLHEAIVGTTRHVILVLFGAVVFVLLIACANVASLMLVRAAARERELAIRTTLGARAVLLFRQMIAESVVLALISGALGLVLAQWGIDALLAMAPETLPRRTEIGLNLPVLLFTFGVSALVGMLFGIVPALRASRAEPADGLRGGRASSARTAGLSRSLIVTLEIAVALVLTIGAGLLIRSFWSLTHVDPGFRHRDAITFIVELPESRYPVPGRAVYPKWPEAIRFYDLLLEKVRALPGVTSAAIALNHPLRRGWTSQVSISGRPQADGPRDEVRMRPVTPGYFETIGVPLLRGRDIQSSDREGAPLVVLINEAMARKYFPSEDPIGQSVEYWGPTKRQIVGIVRDVHFLGLHAPAEPAIYPALHQMPFSQVSILVRSTIGLEAALPALRNAVWSIDRDLAVVEPATLTELLERSVGPQQFQTILLTLFSAVALFLAAIGVFGVVSYQVNSRLRELGIRLALGAQPIQLVLLVLRRGLAMTAAGVAIGLLAALGMTQVLSSMLFGVEPLDPSTFLAVTLVLGLLSLAASSLPAHRASRVDPTIALRTE